MIVCYQSILATELHIHGIVIIANNTASQSGGGIYLYQSEMTSLKTSALNDSGNTALEKGGGIYAVGSTAKNLIQKYLINFVSNTADKFPRNGLKGLHFEIYGE